MGSEMCIRDSRKRLLRAVVAGALLGAALGWFAIRPLIVLIYGEPVAPASATAAILMSGAAFLYTSMLMGQATIAKGERSSILRANLGAVGLSAVLVAPLSVLWGETGAAAALAAGYAARFASLYQIMGPDRGDRSAPVVRSVLGLLAVGGLGFGGAVVWQIFFPDTDSPPENVEVVYVLAGGLGERLDRGLEIHRSSPGALLALSTPDDFDGRASIAVHELCESDPTVVCLTPVHDSTAGEVLTIDAFAVDNGLDNVAIVTSRSHVERVRRWVDRCAASEQIAVIGSEMEYSVSRVRREVLASLDSFFTQRSCPS